jgi:hypothetical protein
VWTKVVVWIRGVVAPHQRAGTRGRRCSPVVAGEDEVEPVRGSPEHERWRRGDMMAAEDSVDSSSV